MKPNLIQIALLLSFISHILLVSCEDPSSLTPYTDLPFEYSVSLETQSSTCLYPGLPLSKITYKGTLTVGSQESMTVVLLEAEDFSWQFEGLLCRNEQEIANGLCLGLRQSSTMMSLERSAGVRRPENGQLSCVEWRTAPAEVAGVSLDYHQQNSAEIDIVTPRESPWFDDLESCCRGESTAQAIQLNINETSQIEGLLSIRYELVVNTPANGSPALLSSNEYFGALALCGGPQNCVDRFQLKASPQ